MDTQTLAQVMGGSCTIQRYDELRPHFTNALRQAGCTSVERVAMFCAQIGHESAGLKYMAEIADGSAYEWRRDLGNVYAGDGKRFKGRGPIQVTGRSNYATLSKWAHGKGYVPTPTFFVDHPTQLEKPEYGFMGAVWYWTTQRQLNALSDRRDLNGATRAINGGLNGLADRRQRYERALAMGAKLLPIEGSVRMEKVLSYERDQVHQDTYYNCGPASVQTIVRSKTRVLWAETSLSRKLGTTTNGTNWIGQFPRVLNELMAGAGYVHREMPNDPPSDRQKQQLWDDIVGSINAGYGVVANIVAPPSNYPRAVWPSTQSPAYRGGTVYHYIAVMGYSNEGGRRYWIADSGFSPYGYWISHDQLASLIPPKGYAYSTAKAPAAPAPKPSTNTKDNIFMALSDKEQRELLDGVRAINKVLTTVYGSRSDYKSTDRPVDTLAGMILNIDARIHEQAVQNTANDLGMKTSEVQAELSKGKTFGDIYREKGK